MKILIFILLFTPLSIFAQVGLQKRGEIIGATDFILVWKKDTFSTKYLSEYFMAQGIAYSVSNYFKSEIIKSIWATKEMPDATLVVLNALLEVKFNNVGWTGYIDFYQFHANK